MKSKELKSESIASGSAVEPEARVSSTEAPLSASTVEVGLNAARTVYWWIVAALLVAYAFSGVTEIAPGEVGVVRRFGRWMKVNNQVVVHRPGLLFALPVPFDRVEKVPVKQERTVEIQLVPEQLEASDEAADLADDDVDQTVANQTSDSDIADEDIDRTTEGEEIASESVPQYLLAGDRGLLGLSLQARYRIADPAAWLMASSDVDAVIRRIVLGATSSVIGRWTSDDVLRRQQRATPETSLTLQSAVLDVAKSQIMALNLGVELSAIEFTSIQPPPEVREAFVAIQDARVDQESWRDAANGEDAEVRLNAERMAQVAIADSKGRLDSIPGKVAAEIQLFEADRAAYESGQGDLVAERIRRETWEAILRDAGRVIALPAGERSQGLWLSVPDAEKQE